MKVSNFYKLDIIGSRENNLLLLTPKNHYDNRGMFSEIWKKDLFEETLKTEFVQENMSISKRDTFRGLHFQTDPPQGKLIRVVSGSATFYELDLRKDSSTYGMYETIYLDTLVNEWLWVPYGFANGFLATSDNTCVIYKCNNYWGTGEGCINYKEVLDPSTQMRIKHISVKDKTSNMKIGDIYLD